jgi:hypothetical protein
MSQDVLCPQCQKRYSLPEDPPATYACTQCGTVLDLSAFRGGAGGARHRAAPPPQPRAPGARRAGGSNAAVTWGIVGVAALVLLVIVVSAGKDPVEEDPRPRKRVEVVEAPPPEPIAAPVDTVHTRKRDRKRTRKGKPNISRVELKSFEWPEAIDSETRNRVETAIATLYRGSRDASDARDYLVGLGHPICGRLVSEFHAIRSSPGFDNREGASMASVIDGTLRLIDGFIEREFKETARIRAWGIYAAPSFIERIAKRWTWWWENEEWRTNPRTPWDPHEEVEGEMKDGYRRPGEGASKSDKKPAYSKPAGSDG